MKNIRFVQTTISIVTSVGINAIPAGIVLALGKSLATSMVLYYLETLTAALLTVIFLLLRAPAGDPGYTEIVAVRPDVPASRTPVRGRQPGNRAEMIRLFLIVSFGFGVIPGVFFISWMVYARANLSYSAVASGISGMIVFQLLNFIAELLQFGALTPAAASSLIDQNVRRIFLIYFSVFGGMLLAIFFAINWFVIPFAILKTLADIAFYSNKRSAINSGLLNQTT
jgi:hypothetical protein